MNLSTFRTVAVTTLGLCVTVLPSASHAKELAYLQLDSRFTGGEYNVNNPSQQTFWFYDQYADARHALMQDGVNLDPVGVLTQQAMENHSDAFFIPIPTNRTASVYPATDTELSAIKSYVLAGRSVIFNLGGAASSAMTNNLISRLGLTGRQGLGTLQGTTQFPDPNQPVISGPKGAVNPFTWDTTAYTNNLGDLRSLVNVNGKSVLPYVEKGDLTSRSGAIFFLLDDNFLTDYARVPTSQQNLFRNMVEYATQDQYLHYTPTSGTGGGGTDDDGRVFIPFLGDPQNPGNTALTAIPEPMSLALLGLGSLSLLRRRRTVK